MSLLPGLLGCVVSLGQSCLALLGLFLAPALHSLAGTFSLPSLGQKLLEVVIGVDWEA